MRHMTTFNRDSEDLSGYAGVLQKHTYTGYCTSFRCYGALYGRGVVKAKEDGPDRCPDCGHALIYRKSITSHKGPRQVEIVCE